LGTHNRFSLKRGNRKQSAAFQRALPSSLFH